MQEYRNEISRLYMIIGKDAEEKNVKNIEEWYSQGRLTYAQKDHLIKFNKNLSK